jgi:hypothetical protein
VDDGSDELRQEDRRSLIAHLGTAHRICSVVYACENPLDGWDLQKAGAMMLAHCLSYLGTVVTVSLFTVFAFGADAGPNQWGRVTEPLPRAHTGRSVARLALETAPPCIRRGPRSSLAGQVRTVADWAIDLPRHRTARSPTCVV